MHVVHYGKYYSPVRGGIETVVEQLCRGLVRRGVAVTALVSNTSPNTVEEMVDGVRVIRLGRQLNLASQPINLGVPRALRELAPDLVHFHTPNPLGALAVLRSGQRPIVVSHHSDIVRQRVLGRPATALQAELYRRARAIIAATPRHIRFSRTLTKYAEKCHVVHYPIEAARFEGRAERAPRSLPAPWQTRRFGLFVGRLVYYKGVEVLLRAIAASPGLHCAIVGRGPLEIGLKRLATELGIDARVLFLGDVEEQELVAMYKAAAFLVLPSVEPSEAFGMVQLEAMCAGTAVISTDLPSGVPYVNQHRQTGLVVPPNHVPALSQAMLELAGNEGLATEMGQAGVRRAKAEFDASPVVDRLMQVYESMA